MNFNFIGNTDIDYIKNNINELDWREHNLRQNLFEPHKHTETLEIMWDIESLHTNKIGKTHPNYYKLNMEYFLNEIKPTYEFIFGNGYFIRVLLVKLKANTNIGTHIDYGESLINCKRTHIPIITNEKVKFTIAGEIKYLKEGEIWEIDNTKEHSVDNNSNEDRIHLILDYYVIKKIKSIL